MFEIIGLHKRRDTEDKEFIRDVEKSKVDTDRIKIGRFQENLLKEMKIDVPNTAINHLAKRMLKIKLFILLRFRFLAGGPSTILAKRLR